MNLSPTLKCQRLGKIYVSLTNVHLLIEPQTFIKASKSNACQVENEVKHKMKQKTMVSCLKQRKSEFVSYPEVPKTRKQICFSYQHTPFLFKLVNLRNHLLGVPPAQSLGAEADCLALLRSTAVLGID